MALGERGTAVLAAVVRPSRRSPGAWGAWRSCPTSPLSLPFPPAGPRALGPQEEAGPGAGGTSGALHHAVPVRQCHLPALPALPARRRGRGILAQPPAPTRGQLGTGTPQPPKRKIKAE